MEKIKKHLKNNFAIYIVLVTCIVILGIAISVNSKPKVEKVDTSMFEVVTLDEALELFETDEPKLLVMSVPTCTATIGYTPYLQIAQAKHRYNTYYLDLTTIDTKSEDFKKLQEKLDFEYNFMGTIDKFSKFRGSIRNETRSLSPINRITNQRMFDISHMHSDLVGTTCFKT